MKKTLLITVALLAGVLQWSEAQAHPGRTNSDGCHNNRKTGDYHCHGSRKHSSSRYASKVDSSPPVPRSSVKSLPDRVKKPHARSPARAMQIKQDKQSVLVSDSVEERLRECVRSSNIYAYWESGSKRCLDSKTGREAMHQP